MRRFALVVWAAMLLCGCSQPTPEAPPVPEASDVAVVASPRRFTKAEFDNYIFGKTKEAIRAEFGPPDAVHDEDDSWVYYRLPVYDAEAGIQTMVVIRFSGVDGPTDEVVSVRF